MLNGRVLLCALAALAVNGCGSDSAEPADGGAARPADAPSRTKAETLDTAGKNVAACVGPNGGPSVTMGAGPKDWRQRAIVAGPVGVLNVPRPPLSSMAPDTRPGLVTKMPILVEGAEPVRVRPTAADVGRVGLLYGPGPHSFEQFNGYESVLFKPCEDRRSTPFPGGIRVTGSDPVTLIVEQTSGTGRWPLPLGPPRRIGQASDPAGE